MLQVQYHEGYCKPPGGPCKLLHHVGNAWKRPQGTKKTASCIDSCAGPTLTTKMLMYFFQDQWSPISDWSVKLGSNYHWKVHQVISSTVSHVSLWTVCISPVQYSHTREPITSSLVIHMTSDSWLSIAAWQELLPPINSRYSSRKWCLRTQDQCTCELASKCVSTFPYTHTHGFLVI